MIFNVSHISDRKRRLTRFCRNFLRSDIHQIENISVFNSDLLTLTPMEAIMLFGWLSRQDIYTSQHIKRTIDKITNIVYKPLMHNLAETTYSSGILKDLNESNLTLLKCLQATKSSIRILTSDNYTPGVELFQLQENVCQYAKHLEILEQQILTKLISWIPQSTMYIEYEKRFNNDLRALTEQLGGTLSNAHFKIDSIIKIIGKLYFRIHLTIYRQNLILFPVYQQFVLRNLSVR